MNIIKSFIKYFLVVWSGIMGGSIVYVAILDKVDILLRSGIILILFFCGFLIYTAFEMMQKTK